MALAENWDIFFNADEFASLAWIGDCPLAGIAGYSIIEDQGVEMRRMTFTCPSQTVKDIRQGETLRMGEPAVTYQVVGIHPDGTGLTAFILEKQD